jgi:hypothetical protein
MRIVFAAVVVSLIAATSYGQSEPGVFAGATKANLITNIISPSGKEDASSFCFISKEDIDREARSVLNTSDIILTDINYDITIIVDVDLYYDKLEEPVDICAARVSVRSGLSTRVYLPFGNGSTEKWVDLFDVANTVIASRMTFSPYVVEMVNEITKSFVEAWRDDQKR